MKKSPAWSKLFNPLMEIAPQMLNKEYEEMGLLLISDTHGKLGTINELSSRLQADAVIHAGDLGFYDDGSFVCLPDRELRLHVVHSDLPRAKKDNLLSLSRIDLIADGRRDMQKLLQRRLLQA